MYICTPSAQHIYLLTNVVKLEIRRSNLYINAALSYHKYYFPVLKYFQRDMKYSTTVLKQLRFSGLLY